MIRTSILNSKGLLALAFSCGMRKHFVFSRGEGALDPVTSHPNMQQERRETRQKTETGKQKEVHSNMVHFPSLMVGSIVSGTGALLLHKQLSHRERLSAKWELAGTSVRAS